MNLALFILSVIGLTHIIVDGEISEPVYEWLKLRLPVVARIMDCHQCSGFWCGLALGPIVSWTPLLWLACGFAGSFLAQLGWLLLDSLERYRSAKELATHLAFALRELDALRRQMATDRFFARLGMERC